MTRERLPDRRQGVNENLIYRKDQPDQVKFAATLNWREEDRIKEVFCLVAKAGSTLQSLLHHACIIASVGLQHGATMADFAHAMGEDDPEAAPNSILALIVRAGVVIDTERGFPPAPVAEAAP